MRVVGRMAQIPRQELFHVVAQHVFQPLRLPIDTLEGNAKPHIEIELPEPVVADDLERDLPPPRRQRDPAVALIVQEAHRFELADHAGHGGGRDLKLRGDIAHGDALAALVAQAPDGFEVVLYGLGDGGHRR